MIGRVTRSAALCALSLLVAGCATQRYPLYGERIESEKVTKLRPNELQIERGQKNTFTKWFVDGPAHYLFSLPTKILLLNWKMGNRNISAETEAALVEYLDKNELRNVKIRLNQYAPGDEWSRLFRNREVGAFWRFTNGFFSVLAYTLIPGRLLGGDAYNQYTNTIYLYSDVRSVALHEGGHAKDFATRLYKGSYGFTRAFPLIALRQEAIASSDALGLGRAARRARPGARGVPPAVPGVLHLPGRGSRELVPDRLLGEPGGHSGTHRRADQGKHRQGRPPQAATPDPVDGARTARVLRQRAGRAPARRSGLGDLPGMSESAVPLRRRAHDQRRAGRGVQGAGRYAPHLGHRRAHRGLGRRSVAWSSRAERWPSVDARRGESRGQPREARRWAPGDRGLDRGRLGEPRAAGRDRVPAGGEPRVA